VRATNTTSAVSAARWSLLPIFVRLISVACYLCDLNAQPWQPVLSRYACQLLSCNGCC
jgi:hypothetical protein